MKGKGILIDIRGSASLDSEADAVKRFCPDARNRKLPQNFAEEFGPRDDSLYLNSDNRQLKL